MSEDCDVLLRQGREQRRAGRIDDAIEYFARAVESKMALLDSEISVDLSDYLIEYADALLLKEETNSTEFLAGAGPGRSLPDADDQEHDGTLERLDSARLEDGPALDADGDEEESLSDIQLAWESFEHTRLCLMSGDSAENNARRFKQLSFVHCRLGDMQALQEQFSDSIADYGLSIEFAMKGDENPRKIAGLIVSLCQTIQVFIMSSDEYKNAISAPVVSDDQDLLTNLDRKLRDVFRTVATTFSLPIVDSPESASRNKLIPMLARDGFLLANSLLTKSAADQASETEQDLQSTIEEINAFAQECDETTQSLPVLDLPVTTNGFQAPSNTSEIVVVPVRRRQAPTNDEPPQKVLKTNDNQESRADKATIID